MLRSRLLSGDDTQKFIGDVRGSGLKVPLAKALPRNLPVLGTVRGAVASNGFQLRDETVDYVGRPPALLGVDDAYALYVVGDSMSPLHRPGDICCVHPGRPCQPGDSIIIQVKNGPTAPIEAYIKILVEETKDWIVTRQLNPSAEMRFKRSTLVNMHHVMTMREILGA